MKSQRLTTEQGIKGFPGPSGLKHRKLLSRHTERVIAPRLQIQRLLARNVFPTSAQDGDAHHYRS